MSVFGTNRNVPGMLVSCAVDKTVALWDTRNTQNNPGEIPFSCGSKDMSVGKLYTVSFYPSSPWILGCGGGGGQLALWDLSSEENFQRRFGDSVIETSMDNAIPEKENKAEEDFEAMMAAGDEAAERARSAASGKKKKKKTKKKAHRKGR